MSIILTPQIQQAQIRLMFEYLGRGLRISVLVSLILAWLLWHQVPAGVLLGWELLLLGVLAGRYLQSRRFHAWTAANPEESIPVDEWHRRLIPGVFLTGLCWGAAGSVFQFYIESQITALVLIISMLALTVTAIPFISHLLRVYLAYLYATIVPTGLTLAYLHSNASLEIMALMAVYLYGIQHAARLYHRSVEDSLKLQMRAEILSRDLSRSNQLLDEFFNNAPVEMYLKDREGRYLRINRQFEKLFDVRDEEVRGKLPEDIHYQDLAESTRQHDLDVLEQGHVIHRHETAILRSDNKAHNLLTVKFPLIDTQGEIYGLGAVVTDITQEQKAQARIEHLANFDALTDLPNRRLLLDRLNHCLAYDRRYRRRGALLFLDLDNFKTINDSLGHSTGDLLLRDVAHRLLNNLRSGDTVARIGGDEFVVLLPEIEDHAHLEHAYYTAEKLRKALEVPFYFPDQVLYVTCSIGISLFSPGNNADADDLLKQADSAMYSAKKAGRNSCRFFSNEMQREADARLKLHNDLRGALSNHGLRLHYQPQLDSAGRIAGAEALLRWKHKDSGEISPAVFIPMTEESGLILAIGQWVIREACEQLQRWGENPAMTALPYLAINISPKQFHHPEFVHQLESVLAETGVDPQHLALELTEGVELENLEDTIQRMHKLKSLGVRLVIDDFGIGYSSLAYLKRLPLDAVKIDKAFIQDVHGDPHDAAIVEAIIRLSHSLGLRAIAEGVENPRQLAALEAMNCGTYQGFYFSRPLPAAEFADYISDSGSHLASA